MEEMNQYAEQKLTLDNFLEWYIDMTVRALLGFLIIGLGLTFLLKFFFHLDFIYILPIIIIVSILLSPFMNKVFNRIKVGKKINDRYMNFLNKMVGTWKG